MRKTVLLLTLAVMTGVALCALAELNIHTKEEGIVVDATEYEERFNLDEALECLAKAREALISFADLTERVRRDKLVPESELERIGNTAWETQNLGLPNCGAAIEGTLRRQHYELKTAEFELAQMRLEKGQTSQSDLDDRKQAFEEAEAAMQKFWDEFQIAD